MSICKARLRKKPLMRYTFIAYFGVFCSSITNCTYILTIFHFMYTCRPADNAAWIRLVSGMGTESEWELAVEFRWEREWHGKKPGNWMGNRNVGMGMGGNGNSEPIPAHLYLASDSSGVHAMWPNRDRHRAWTVAERCGCSVFHLSSFVYCTHNTYFFGSDCS